MKIYTSSGVITKTVNQQQNTAQWFFLGTFNLSGQAKVVIESNSSSKSTAPMPSNSHQPARRLLNPLHRVAPAAPLPHRAALAPPVQPVRRAHPLHRVPVDLQVQLSSTMAVRGQVQPAPGLSPALPTPMAQNQFTANRSVRPIRFRRLAAEDRMSTSGIRLMTAGMVMYQ